MNCEFEQQLHAYHDGELNAAARTVFESHLAGCGECTTALAQLRSISNLFAATPRERLSQIAMHRLNNRVDEAMERGLIRFAWSLSGIAAAVLIGGSIWLSQAQPKQVQQAQAAPPWVEAVVSSHSLSDNAVTPAAQWYLADASSKSDDVP